jgi:chromosome segregation ATPase
VQVSAAEVPQPPPAPAESAHESARLMLQIRGLLFELGEAQARLRSREAEIQDLRAQLDDARSQIEDLERDIEARRRA